ncbi:alpha-hydroxy acid oxidase [Inquilinus limosus]|nr:alpha-hydroxy acid oxidase [Inquilinus limosus]
MRRRFPSPTGSAETFVTSTEIIAAARRRLADDVWAYLVGGAETETTLARDRDAFDRIALRQRVLTGIETTDVAADAFGRRSRLPVILSSIGSLDQLHPDGIEGAAKAAEAFGVPIAVSSVLKDGLVRGARAAPSGIRWFQLYIDGDATWATAAADRAEAAGYQALVVTVDLPVMGLRERPPSPDLPRFERPDGRHRARLSWDDLGALVRRTPLPVVIKGITAAEDAARACEIGAAGIWVSTHGGRQLDQGLGALDCLPEVSASVDGRARIILDGGVRRGTDVIKAIALGADLVAIGRLYGFGLAAAGQFGVERILTLLEEEIRTTLVLLGVGCLAALGPHMLRAAHPAYPAQDPLHRAFPHLAVLLEQASATAAESGAITR